MYRIYLLVSDNENPFLKSIFSELEYKAVFFRSIEELNDSFEITTQKPDIVFLSASKYSSKKNKNFDFPVPVIFVFSENSEIKHYSNPLILISNDLLFFTSYNQ